VDSATGADNKYPESVTVMLVPASGGGGPVAAPSPVVRNSVVPN
jgi:hypothetical protein